MYRVHNPRFGKEGAPGPKPGDKQPTQEGGRGGTGTRPSGTGKGGKQGSGGKK